MIVVVVLLKNFLLFPQHSVFRRCSCFCSCRIYWESFACVLIFV